MNRNRRLSSATDSSHSLPTVFLPQIPHFLSSLDAATTSSTLFSLVNHLRTLYAPIASSRPTPTAQDSGYSSEAEDAEDDEQIGKEDVFERTYAKEWLLAVVKRGGAWVDELEDLQDVDEERDLRLEVVDLAASLVASLSETSASGSILRPLLLPTCTADEPLLITLHDALPSSLDPTSVGLQSWGSSILLARRIALDPTAFGVGTSNARVLELGAGTGLLSLVWKGMSDRLDTAGDAQVIATDFHDGVLDNLRRNIFDNPSLSSDTPIHVRKLDWSAVHTSHLYSTSVHAPLLMPAPFNKPFTTLLAADVVYGPLHALWLRSCVEQFLLKPETTSSVPALSALSLITTSSHPDPAFHLIVPLRPTHTPAIESITTVFPRAEDLPPREEDGEWRLAVKSLLEVERERGVGRVDEGAYRLYEIGWC